MKRFLTLLVIAMPLYLMAQTDQDVLRYSMQDPIGTARYAGAGGAFGALGGDFTTLSTNPAGIGVYRTSEMTFTPSLRMINNRTSFLGEEYNENRYRFYFSNLGFVFTKIHTDAKDQPRTSGWVSSNFGFGINRLADFNDRVYFSGYNNENSLLDRYTEIAAGTAPDDMFGTHSYGAGLAYDAYLIDPIPGDTMNYMSKIPNGNVQQSKEILTSGSLQEIVLSFGGNYNNKLYLGATIGIPLLNFESQATYREEDIHDSIPDFVSFDQFEYLNAGGAGVNLKIGAIYRVADFLRLGAAVHTPTSMGVNERFYTTINPDITVPGVDVGEVASPDGVYDYRIVTPWRLIGSAAVIIAKSGFISVDYEFVDYGEGAFKAKYAQDKGFENKINSDVNTKYGAASIIRLGGEYVYDVFRLRAGYTMMASPFNNNIENGGADLAKNTISFGAGLKYDSFFLDLAYTTGSQQEFHVPYLLDSGEPVGGAIINKRDANILLTAGFRF